MSVLVAHSSSLSGFIADDISKSMTPLMMARCWHSEVDWNLTSVPQVHAYGRVMRQPRGKLLGNESYRISLYSS